MPRPADHRRPVLRRAAPIGRSVGGAVLAILLVAGCGAGARPADDLVPGRGIQQPAPPAAGEARADRSADRGRPARPTPSPTTAGTAPPASGLPAVPVRSADLADAARPATVPPARLDVPALGISVPVDAVGVRDDGQMEIPPLVERAGWYRFGSAPGEPAGTAVIAAHVDSVASAGLGPFARLRDAVVGDVVDVTLADGVVRRYAVSAVERRAKPEIEWSEFFVRDGAPRLVLVTCGGTFRRDVGSYTDNVVVTAEPVGG